MTWIAPHLGELQSWDLAGYLFLSGTWPWLGRKSLVKPAGLTLWNDLWQSFSRQCPLLMFLVFFLLLLEGESQEQEGLGGGLGYLQLHWFDYHSWRTGGSGLGSRLFTVALIWLPLFSSEKCWVCTPSRCMLIYVYFSTCMTVPIYYAHCKVYTNINSKNGKEKESSILKCLVNCNGFITVVS